MISPSPTTRRPSCPPNHPLPKPLSPLPTSRGMGKAAAYLGQVVGEAVVVVNDHHLALVLLEVDRHRTHPVTASRSPPASPGGQQELCKQKPGRNGISPAGFLLSLGLEHLSAKPSRNSVRYGELQMGTEGS